MAARLYAIDDLIDDLLNARAHVFDAPRSKSADNKTARRSTNAPAHEESTNALASDIERLTQSMYEVLRASGYVKPRAARATEEKLRRLLRRLNLSTDDAELWLGMLRQIQWKLDTNEERNRAKG